MTEAEIYQRYTAAPDNRKSRTIGEIADECETTAPDIMRILSRQGVVFPIQKPEIMVDTIQTNGEKTMERMKWTHETDEQLSLWKSEGLTYEQMAERLGTTKKAVGMRFCKMNRPKHTPKPTPVPPTEPGEPVELTATENSAADTLMAATKHILEIAVNECLKVSEVSVHTDESGTTAIASGESGGIKIWSVI